MTEETASPPTETYRGVVNPWHCDHVGHMNVIWYVGKWYVGKFDEATWIFFAGFGVPPGHLRREGRQLLGQGPLHG